MLISSSDVLSSFFLMSITFYTASTSSITSLFLRNIFSLIYEKLAKRFIMHTKSSFVVHAFDTIIPNCFQSFKDSCQEAFKLLHASSLADQSVRLTLFSGFSFSISVFTIFQRFVELTKKRSFHRVTWRSDRLLCKIPTKFKELAKQTLHGV